MALFGVGSTQSSAKWRQVAPSTGICRLYALVLVLVTVSKVMEFGAVTAAPFGAKYRQIAPNAGRTEAPLGATWRQMLALTGILRHLALPALGATWRYLVPNTGNVLVAPSGAKYRQIALSL